MNDRDAVIDRINDLFLATDDRDWTRAHACFTDEVDFDMSSAGGPSGRIASADIVSGWDHGLAQLDAIHHQAGNYRVNVTGDEATASCYGIAYHYRKNETGRNTRVFVGSYDFHLVRDAGGEWRIDAFTFHLKFIDGNPEL